MISEQVKFIPFSKYLLNACYVQGAKKSEKEKLLF